jgi:hypothetical protein
MARKSYFHLRLTDEERAMIKALAGNVPQKDGETVRALIRTAYDEMQKQEAENETEPIQIHILQPA